MSSMVLLLPLWSLCLFFLSWLLAIAKNSSTMLTEVQKATYLLYSQSLRGQRLEGIQFSNIKCDAFLLLFFVDAHYQAEEVSSIPRMLRIFMKRCWILWNASGVSMNYFLYLLRWFVSLNPLLCFTKCWIPVTAFQTLNYFWDKPSLATMYYLFYVSSDYIC